ncbi:hypothetical protein P280DRAFT_26663 [Massarina eburnea CBS 473.64]|uniref:Uncharacterized protein n=1 Tax=Massarina eburnea CBS 473.64 TaxID=1395130 RepID=A0A6A6S056_9PLEO|nr:hypothetical protein P280DRAFT_26663 [Massarina eburnea CBS 473.64]
MRFLRIVSLQPGTLHVTSPALQPDVHRHRWASLGIHRRVSIRSLATKPRQGDPPRRAATSTRCRCLLMKTTAGGPQSRPWEGCYVAWQQRLCEQLPRLSRSRATPWSIWAFQPWANRTPRQTSPNRRNHRRRTGRLWRLDALNRWRMPGLGKPSIPAFIDPQNISCNLPFDDMTTAVPGAVSLQKTIYE